MANPTNLVQPPRRRPRKGGIKAVANVVSADRMFATERLDWMPEGCSFPSAAPGACWAEAVALDEKQYEGLELGTSAQVFVGYAGVACQDLSAEQEFLERARTTLEAGEDRFVEAKLVDVLEAIDPIATDHATWAAAIAAAEDRADDRYVGQPILVMNRGDAQLAFTDGALEADKEGNLWTANGTPVLATSAFAAGTLYITGDITLWTGPVAATTAQAPQFNTALALAERAYALAIDCEFADARSVTPVP